jgi:hypothetical protein
MAAAINEDKDFRSERCHQIRFIYLIRAPQFELQKLYVG